MPRKKIDSYAIKYDIELEQEDLIKRVKEEIIDTLDEDEQKDILECGIGEWLQYRDVYDFEDYYTGLYCGLQMAWDYINSKENNNDKENRTNIFKEKIL